MVFQWFKSASPAPTLLCQGPSRMSHEANYKLSNFPFSLARYRWIARDCTVDL